MPNSCVHALECSCKREVFQARERREPSRAAICGYRRREVRSHERIVAGERIVRPRIEPRLGESELAPINELAVVKQPQGREHRVAFGGVDRDVPRDRIGAPHFAQDRGDPPCVDDTVGVGRGDDPSRPTRRFEAPHRELERVSSCRSDMCLGEREPRIDHVDRDPRRLSCEPARSHCRVVAAVVAVDDHVERPGIETLSAFVALIGKRR